MDNNPNPNLSEAKDFFAKIDSQTGGGKVETEGRDVFENPQPQPAPTTENPSTPPSSFSFQPEITPKPGSTISPPPILKEEFPVEGKGNLKRKIILLAVSLLILGIVFSVAGKILSKIKGGGVITLNYWGLWEPVAGISEIIADYQKTHPKVKINYVLQSPKDYRERLQLALEKGEGPDIFRFHNTWVPMFKNDLSTVPPTLMDAATFERLFYPVVRSDLRSGSNYLGIPLYMDNIALFYNEEIFNTAGKIPPKTWDDFRKVALELTVKDTSGKIQTSGAALGITGNVDHWSDILGLMLIQNGADLANPISSLAEDALSFYTLFYRSDHIWDETLPSSTYYFASGRLAMYFGPSWRVFDIKALNPNLKFRIIPVPQLPDVNVTWATYWVEGVSKKSSYQDQAWEFLKYLSTKEVMQKLYQGQSKLRLFGEPYSRTDMADLLNKEPYVGVFIEQAPKARSWYLCSRTFDNGINDKIIKYYEDAVNAVNRGGSSKSALATVAQGVTQVLGQYGLK